jgi:hypothetical protein
LEYKGSRDRRAKEIQGQHLEYKGSSGKRAKEIQLREQE